MKSCFKGRNRTNPAATNVTYLLNNLLDKYDNSLRPDIGGESLKTSASSKNCFYHDNE